MLVSPPSACWLPLWAWSALSSAVSSAVFTSLIAQHCAAHYCDRASSSIRCPMLDRRQSRVSVYTKDSPDTTYFFLHMYIARCYSRLEDGLLTRKAMGTDAMAENSKASRQHAIHAAECAPEKQFTPFTLRPRRLLCHSSMLQTSVSTRSPRIAQLPLQ